VNRILRLIALLFVFLVVSPGAAHTAVEPEDPEELYEQGLRQMKRGYHDEAILSFEKVRNHFPFNKYSVLSELRVADCLFEKASFLESVDSYRQFARLHPRHPEVDYAIYRSARAEFKLAPRVPQRDQMHAKLGLKHVSDFEDRFPESEYLDEVNRLRFKAQRRLGRAATQVGNFYWKQRQWTAAERRYRMSVDDYPDSPTVSKAAYRRGMCLIKLDRSGEATTVFQRLVDGDPDSRWGKRAQGALSKATPPAPIPDEPAEVTPPSSDPPTGG
jgi:outer membrane protein assembly factor BamD